MNENIVLEGANPSAEGEDEDGGQGEGETMLVYDIEDQFRLVWLKEEAGMKPSKDAFKAHLKGKTMPPHPFHAFCFSLLTVPSAYVKKVNNKLKEKGASEETIKQFQAGAPGAVKKILANYDNYDVLMGSSYDGDAMYVPLSCPHGVSVEQQVLTMPQARPD